MKVEASRAPAVPAFRPVTVTITLETHAELQSVRAVVGNLDLDMVERVVRHSAHKGGNEEAAFKFASGLYFALDDAVDGAW